MSTLKPFNKLPGLNTASILLVEEEGKLQDRLADELVKEEGITVNVRLAFSLPLPVEKDETRPRIDLVVFIINLMSERSFNSAEASLQYLDPGYFLGKVCFMVTNARNALVPPERLDAARKMAASLHCPLLFAEDQTAAGVTSAAERLLSLLKVSAGLVPVTTALYLSHLTKSSLHPDLKQPSF